MSVQTILEFAFALIALVILHEFGHFIACRLFNIEVDEFGLGLPSPKSILLFESGGTKFTFNWLLLGGFVRPKGENDPNVPGGLAAASPWKRICVFLAGPLMNLTVGVVLYALLFSRFGYPSAVPNQMEVYVPTTKDFTNSPANQAGLQTCDIFTDINGTVPTDVDTARTAIYDNLGKPITITYQRDGETAQVSLTPDPNPTPEKGAIGVNLLGNPLKFEHISWYAVWTHGAEAVYQYANALITLPGKLIRKQIPAAEGRMVGIKGMADIYNSVRSGSGPANACIPRGVNVVNFFAAITISLGLLNLLPIPALDGGQILFVLPEILFKRRIPPEYAGIINGIFLLLLIALLLFVNLQDFIHPFKP
jgi:regulator of sigma E protease